MNIVVFFILLFLITLRGIRPIRFGMSGVCLRSNRATGVSAVCYGLTGPVCFKAGDHTGKMPTEQLVPGGRQPRPPWSYLMWV